MKKKFVLGLTSLVVTSAVAIGGTLAFMTNQTGTKENKFRVDAGSEIKGAIQEPLWDGLDFSGAEVKPQTAPELGQNIAKAITPGLEIPKNPSLKNTTPKASAFMAMKVTYTDASSKADRSKFNAIASLLVNAGWEKADTNVYTQFTDTDSDIYFYVGTDSKLKEVPSNDTTATLFDKVTIKDKDITFKNLTDNEFNIKVIGGAVQTTDIDDATARTELVNLLK